MRHFHPVSPHVLPVLLPVLCLGLCLCAEPAFGWGNEGHEAVNRAAAQGLGPEVPGYLRESVPRLTYLGPEPDRWRIRELETLDRGAAPDHFIDLELAKGIDPQDPPPNRHEYARIVARNLRRPPHNVGYGPYRVVELCQRIEAHIAALALVDPEDSDAALLRQQAEENAVFTAGILGHYVADLANPHHCTEHYNGWVGESNPEEFATDKGTHWRFESAFVSRIQDHLQVTVSAPQQADLDYTRAIWDLVVESNGLVPELYRLDKAGAFEEGEEESEAGLKGRAFAQARMIRGATLLRDLWATACSRGEQRARSERLRLELKAALQAEGFDLRVSVSLERNVRVWGDIPTVEDGPKVREIVARFEGIAGTNFRLKALY